MKIPKTMKLEYTKPNTSEGCLNWQAKSEFISAKSLRSEFGISITDPRLLENLTSKLGDRMYFASGKKPEADQLVTWFSRIKNWANQEVITVDYDRRPAATYTDKKNDNLIDVFDFSDQLGKNLDLKIDFKVTSFETTLISSPTTERGKSAKELHRYLQSEKHLEQTPEIKQLATTITNKKDSALKNAKNIFDWIVDNLKYEYPPKERGANYALASKSGDCGEFSLLFISLCRSAGLPARFVSGMWLVHSPDTEFHTWAEVYADGIGWIPVDCAVAYLLKNKDENFVKLLGDRDDYNYFFGNLDNNRVIFSKGNNISLYTPKGRKPSRPDSTSLFMQPDAIYPHVVVSQAGIIAIDISSSCDVNKKKC